MNVHAMAVLMQQQEQARKLFESELFKLTLAVLQREELRKQLEAAIAELEERRASAPRPPPRLVLIRGGKR